MRVLSVRNVNQGLREAIRELDEIGIRYPSRNGPMIEHPEPVTTVFRYPCERVLFCPHRDANPFFHLMEAMWMLMGRNDVDFVARFASNMRNYSDDGETLNGAYGYRWRIWFGRDQLDEAISILKKNPMDRRVVLQHWDGSEDLNSSSLDVPCNTAIFFKLRDSVLDMTVTNRSNDVIWGTYGANAVHFSVLQEYVASHLKVKVGNYYQVSNSFHAYPELSPLWNKLREIPPSPDLYQQGVKFRPLFDEHCRSEEWDEDLYSFMVHVDGIQAYDPDVYVHSFVPKVLAPLYKAWQAFEDREDRKRYQAALGHAAQCAADDWRLAATQWLLRRFEIAKKKGTAE